MLGVSTLRHNSSYNLMGLLIGQTTLRVQLQDKTHCSSEIRKDFENDFIVKVFQGRFKGVKELYEHMIKFQDYQVMLKPKYCINFKFTEPFECEIILPLQEYTPLQKVQKSLSYPLTQQIELKQEQIEKQVVQKIFANLLENSQFSKQVQTRNQQKMHRILEEIKKSEELIEKQNGEIKQLRRSQEELKNQLKMSKNQIKKMKSSRQSQCDCDNVMKELFQEFNSQKACIKALKEEIQYLQQMFKNYQGRKIPPSEKEKKTKKKVNFTPILPLSICQPIKINYQTPHLSNFTITNGHTVQLKNTLPSQNWSYIFLNNTINYDEGLYLKFDILHCSANNISIGIVEQIYANESNCYNASSCVEYCGFSKMIFEGGKGILQCGSGINQNDEIRLQIKPYLGMLVFKNFNNLFLEYESYKLKKFRNLKYSVFLRLKDIGDKVRISHISKGMVKDEEIGNQEQFQ